MGSNAANATQPAWMVERPYQMSNSGYATDVTVLPSMEKPAPAHSSRKSRLRRNGGGGGAGSTSRSVTLMTFPSDTVPVAGHQNCDRPDTSSISPRRAKKANRGLCPRFACAEGGPVITR
jgi:hypothetical protein